MKLQKQGGFVVERFPWSKVPKMLIPHIGHRSTNWTATANLFGRWQCSIWFRLDAVCVCPKDFSKMLHLHLKSTQILAAYCWRRCIMCFKLRPKHHCLWHVANDVSTNQLNPRIFHVWGDEKWLGRVKRIAVKCHGATVQKRAMERYILSLSHYLHSYGDSRCWWRTWCPETVPKWIWFQYCLALPPSKQTQYERLDWDEHTALQDKILPDIVLNQKHVL